MVTAKPVCWDSDADPATLLGDPLWENYQVNCDVLLEQPGYADIVGHMEDNTGWNVIRGYHLRLTDKGHWSLFVDLKKEPFKKVLAEGELPSAAGLGKWHKLSLRFVDNQISAAIDDSVVANKILDDTYSSGLVSLLANRWQTAQFMNFSVVPQGQDPAFRFIGNLAKEGAKVIACDSQAPESPMERAIDGNPATFWHTAWKPSPAPLPHYITIDLGKTRTLQGLSIMPRQDQAGTRVAEGEVYMSDDSAQWGNPVATFKLKNKSTAQNIWFHSPATGRYLKVVIKSTQSQNDPNAAISELGIIE